MPSGTGSAVGLTSSSPAITFAKYSKTSLSIIRPSEPLPDKPRQLTLFSSANRLAKGAIFGSTIILPKLHNKNNNPYHVLV